MLNVICSLGSHMFMWCMSIMSVMLESARGLGGSQDMAPTSDASSPHSRHGVDAGFS